MMKTSTGAVRCKGNKHARVVDNEDEDKINTLPNFVFSNILIFLPIEDVVATSSLSRRWKPVWILVRNLCFDDDVAMGIVTVPGVRLAAFQVFVNSVIARTDPISIQIFSLRCVSPIPMAQLDLWVSKAIMRNVREMDIDLLEYERMHLPANMCSLTTLEVLRLCSDFALLNHSDGVCFPNLKILHIFMQYPKNRVKEKLFFSCLSLTELNIMVFILPYDPPANFIIQSATLNTLTFVTPFA